MIQRRRRRICCLTIWLVVQYHEMSVLWGWQHKFLEGRTTTTKRTRSSSTLRKAAFSTQHPSLSSPYDVQTNRHTRSISRRRQRHHDILTGRKNPCSTSTAIHQSELAEDEHEASHHIHDDQHNPHNRRYYSIIPTRIVSSLVSRLPRFRSRNNGKQQQQQQQPEEKKEKPALLSTQEVAQIQRENLLLRGALQRLEVENERLHRKMARSIVLESFEGEGALWSPRIFNNQTSTTDYDNNSLVNGGTFATTTTSPLFNPTTTMTSEELLAQEASLWCDDDMEDSCPVEPDVSFGEALRDRAYWLVGLLALQSCSGLILAHNEALIQHHPFIVYFLTMLVGAGGNAGNQASVRVIRGLALGTLNELTQTRFLAREFKMAVALSCILSVAGFVRAAAFKTPFPETLAVTMALFLIVSTSVCLGAVLPLLLKRIGIDPAHSSTTIQVIMDILGVVLAVVVSSLLLDSPVGNMIISRLGG